MTSTILKDSHFVFSLGFSKTFNKTPDCGVVSANKRPKCVVETFSIVCCSSFPFDCSVVAIPNAAKTISFSF